MNNESFDLLKMDFPIFEFRNVKPYPAQISLTNGDSVQAQGFATVKIAANQFYQIPDLSTFKPINPSMEDYIKYGVIGGKDEEVDDAPSTPAPSIIESNSTEQKEKPEDLPTASENLTGASIKEPVTSVHSTPSAKPAKFK